MGIARAAHTIAAGTEELVQHVVLVGGHHQPADGQAHPFGDVTGQHVAEVAAGHGERDLLRLAVGAVRLAGRGQQIAPEVIHHLGHHACPVDGIDAADAVPFLEGEVTRDGFHEVLAVVEHALDGDVVDVVVHQAEHLRALEGTHPAGRREHEHAQVLAAAHGVFGGAAGIPRGGTDDVQPAVLFEQRVLEQPAQQLHGHVLEGQRGAVGELLDVQRALRVRGRLQRHQGRDVFGAEDGRRVGLVDQAFQVVGRDVIAVARQHLEGQVGVGQAAPRLQRGVVDLRDAGRHHQAAIGRQAAEQDVGETLGGHAAPGGQIFHGRPVQIGQKYRAPCNDAYGMARKPGPARGR